MYVLLILSCVLGPVDLSDTMFPPPPPPPLPPSLPLCLQTNAPVTRWMFSLSGCYSRPASASPLWTTTTTLPCTWVRDPLERGFPSLVSIPLHPVHVVLLIQPLFWPLRNTQTGCCCCTSYAGCRCMSPVTHASTTVAVNRRGQFPHIVDSDHHYCVLGPHIWKARAG